LDPLPWRDYFGGEFYIENGRAAEVITHHVYITPPLNKGPLFVTHHGAGSSGLSFALFASEIRKILPAAGVLSLDARGHGETFIKTREDALIDEMPDLSLTVLSQDLLDVILLTQNNLAWPELPGIVLVGHSLGGAVIADVAASGKLGNAVLGFAVLDVVEGSVLNRKIL
jgi:protein phosphatase methylesterase 1